MHVLNDMESVLVCYVLLILRVLYVCLCVLFVYVLNDRDRILRWHTLGAGGRVLSW